jgi:hypothetical protein
MFLYEVTSLQTLGGPLCPTLLYTVRYGNYLYHNSRYFWRDFWAKVRKLYRDAKLWTWIVEKRWQKEAFFTITSYMFLGSLNRKRIFQLTTFCAKCRNMSEMVISTHPHGQGIEDIFMKQIWHNWTSPWLWINSIDIWRSYGSGGWFNPPPPRHSCSICEPATSRVNWSKFMLKIMYLTGM